MHMTQSLTSMALVLGLTLALGLFFERFRQPSIIGYSLAGILLGPSGFAMIADREGVTFLAELGVLMLLFLLGLELSLRSFKSVLGSSFLITLGQLVVSGLLMVSLGFIFDLSSGLVVVMTCGLALSSTAVAIKMLENIQELRTDVGRIAIGVLIAQDLAIVPMMVVLKSLGQGSWSMTIVYKVLVSVAILGALIWLFSRRQKIHFPLSRYVTDSKELVPIAGLGFCFGAAALTGLLGLSAAYGAFLGGLILGNTTERHVMVEATKPIQTVLLMVFFLSIGLLLDLQYIAQHYIKVTVLLFFITIGKTILNIGLIHVLRQPWQRSFLAGLALSQVGEFTFLLTSIGFEANLIDGEGQKLIISLTALSLALSPFWFTAARRMHDQAPPNVDNLNMLIETVYGPELGLLGKIKHFFLHVFAYGVTKMKRPSDDSK
jgi:CPA2 family monovalent cation:H+ antiporter-2